MQRKILIICKARDLKAEIAKAFARLEEGNHA